MKLNEEENKAFANVAQSRNGQLILGALKKHKEELVIAWVGNANSEHGAHMRGKVSVIFELIKILESLSISKE